MEEVGKEMARGVWGLCGLVGRIHIVVGWTRMTPVARESGTEHSGLRNIFGPVHVRVPQYCRVLCVLMYIPAYGFPAPCVPFQEEVQLQVASPYRCY